MTERNKAVAERAIVLLKGEGFLRLPEVLALVPVSPAVWWHGCKTGRYPKGVKIGPRCTGWHAPAIRALVEQLASADGNKVAA